MVIPRWPYVLPEETTLSFDSSVVVSSDVVTLSCCCICFPTCRLNTGSWTRTGSTGLGEVIFFVECCAFCFFLGAERPPSFLYEKMTLQPCVVIVVLFVYYPTVHR